MTHHHRARKRFGQHFLTDEAIIEQIVSAFQIAPGETIVEIGPGLGALTKPLLEQCEKLHVVELDRDLIADMHAWNNEKLIIHESDALKFDFASIGCEIDSASKIRIIGNLPYNISTPLMIHLSNFHEHICDMLFMLQKEVVTRLAAVPNEKNYGRLTVMMQYFYKVQYLFDVPPEAFSPPPRVNSAIVRLQPHDELPYKANDFALFSKVVRSAFNQRRKTLRNSLRDLISAEQLEVLGIDSKARAEQLSIEQFVAISNYF